MLIKFVHNVTDKNSSNIFSEKASRSASLASEKNYKPLAIFSNRLKI